MGDDDPVPTVDELVTTAGDVSSGWGVWCPEDEGLISADLVGELDAASAAEEHNAGTGHTAGGTLQLAGVVAVDAQNLQWPFCLRYNGRPWQSTSVSAPSPEEAADAAAAIVAFLNSRAPQLGFPPLFSATGGLCPPRQA